MAVMRRSYHHNNSNEPAEAKSFQPVGFEFSDFRSTILHALTVRVLTVLIFAAAPNDMTSSCGYRPVVIQNVLSFLRALLSVSVPRQGQARTRRSRPRAGAGGRMMC